MDDLALNFDSWGEYVTAAEQATNRWMLENDHGAGSHSTRDATFHGTRNWSEAIRFARQGWPDGLAKIQRAIINTPAANRYAIEPVIVHDVAGYLPDIAAYVSGDPACMMRDEDVESANRPILSIVIDLYANGGIDADSMFKHGAAILAAVDALEQAGVAVEISLFIGVEEVYRKGGARFTSIVKFKHAGEVLDLERAAFAIANVATRRRFHFALRESYADWEKPLGGHDFGMPINAPPEWFEGQLLMPSIDQKPPIPDEIIKRAQALLAEQGMELTLT